MLEICVDSLESALNAIHGGADELEVCSSLGEGGLTPTAGLVHAIQKLAQNKKNGAKIHSTCNNNCSCSNNKKFPKVNVMLRCRTGSDFCFSQTEIDTMLLDLEIFKSYNVDRFVFGALTPNCEIDVVLCKKVIALAKPIPVTFHRAFDLCKEPKTSLQLITEVGFSRLLTSGQQLTAIDEKAVALIKELLEISKNKIEIMPGAGVTYKNAKIFIDMGCKIVHSSCKKLRELPKLSSKVSMGNNESETLIVTDEADVKKIKSIIL